MTTANKSNGSAAQVDPQRAAGRTTITRADVMPSAEYARRRKELRAQVSALKRGNVQMFVQGRTYTV